MISTKATDVSVAGLAYSAGFLRVAPMNLGAAAHPAPAAARAAMPAHAVWPFAAITPQRKRRAAAKTDASVNRGST